MPKRIGDIARILGDESERTSRVLLSLDEPAFETPTRCPPWDVKELSAHMLRALNNILVYGAEPLSSPPDADSISYWRRFDPVADAREVSERAAEVAASFSSGAELAESFDELWRRAVAFLEETDPSTVVRTFAPSLRIDEYAKTRVLEMGVHGLDLADALGRDHWLTSDAGAMIREILEGLLGSSLPGELAWDDATFAETATGRRGLTETERALLGDRAAEFPLFS